MTQPMLQSEYRMLVKTETLQTILQPILKTQLFTVVEDSVLS